MQFPWKRRADDEMEHRIAAEQRLEAAQADWPKILNQAKSLRGEKDLNSWTYTVRTIFGKAGR